MSLNLWCLESMPNFSRVGMIDEDIPNVPDRGRSPPCGFYRSQIRAPCALIKDLSEETKKSPSSKLSRLNTRSVLQKIRNFERRSIRCYEGSLWYQGSFIPLTPIPGIELNSESPSLVASQTLWCPFLTSPAKEFKCFARQQEFPSSKCSHVETLTFLLYRFWINIILFLIFVRSHSRTSLPCSFVESNSFFFKWIKQILLIAKLVSELPTYPFWEQATP